MEQPKMVKEELSEASDDSENNESETEQAANSTMSEYERTILKRIESRKKFLAQMGFPEAVKELRESVAKTPKPAVQARRKSTPRRAPSPLPPREPSRRLRKLTASGDPLNESTNTGNLKTEPLDNEDAKPVDGRFLGSLKMEASVNVLTDLSCGVSEYDASLDLSSCSISEFGDLLSSLKLLSIEKTAEGRIQSMLVHPSPLKPVVVCGDKYGNIGVWDVRATCRDGIEVSPYRPHRKPVNCLSVSRATDSKLYSTSHDGTIVEFDFNKGIFSNIFATEFDDRITHLTWHDELEGEVLLVGHGNGDVGLLDTRAGNTMRNWIDCFERSVRTVQHHPLQPHYFLVSSGTGSFKIFDLRKAKEAIAVVEHPKTLTSAFFSHRGSSIVSTCSDDCLRIYDSSKMDKLPLTASYAHNNCTGRWLSVFKAMWVPRRDDLFHIGSLLNPRRIQFFTASGDGILRELTDEKMLTISSVISFHPTLPLLAGANSSGRVHLLGPPHHLDN